MSDLLFSDRDRSNILADVARTQQTPKAPSTLDAVDQFVRDITDGPRLVADAPSIAVKGVAGAFNEVKDFVYDRTLGTTDPAGICVHGQREGGLAAHHGHEGQRGAAQCATAGRDVPGDGQWAVCH